MAKNIPVISKKDEFLGTLIADRLPEMVKADETDLERLVGDLVDDPKLLKTYKRKTDEFMSVHEKSAEFLKLLDKEVNTLQNKL